VSSRSGNLKLTGSRGTRSRRIPFYIYNLFFIHKYNASPIAAEIYKALELLRQQTPKIYPKFQPVIDGYEKFLATFDEKFPTYTSGYKLQQISPLARTLKALLAFIGATLSIALFAVAVISTTSNTHSPLAIGFFISAYAAVILSIVHGSLSRKANYRFVRTDGTGITISCPSSQSRVIMLPRWMRSAFLGTFLFFASPGSTNAQTISGKIINGVDSTGVPGITVKVQTTTPYTNYTGTTGPNGEFSVVTNIEDENYASGSVEATVTSISSKPYITIQNIDKQEAEITIYDITGREIKKINAPLTNGINNIQWNARNEYNEPVSNGVYLTKISVGGKILNKIFMIMKNDIEGTPQHSIRREIKKIEKTTANYKLGITTLEEKGYEATETELVLENSTTPLFHITIPKKEFIENTFPGNGTEIKTLSNLLNHYDINTTAKPVYPIQINTTGLPANIKTAITSIANEINNKTGKNITKITTSPNTNSSLLECVVVNNDTTIPIKTNNTFGIWTVHDTIWMPSFEETEYIPKKGKIYINNSHQLTTEELTTYIRKTLQKIILNTQKETYNKENNSYPKGTQEISNDEIKLLKFYFNNKRPQLKEFKTTYSQTVTPTDYINITGTITIPDTISWQEKPVVGEIITINGEKDTTNKEGKYAFTNTTKGLKNIKIDSVRTDGTVLYHQYEEEGTNVTQDTTRTEVMFPKITLDYTFYGLKIILEYFAYNMGVNSPTGNEFYRKPIYPMQIYIEPSIPVNWIPYMTNAINDWNTLSHTKLFEIVNTPYTEWDKTSIRIVGVNMGSGGNDGECESGEHINNRPLRYFIKLNTGSTMNGTTNIYQVTGHELLRTIYRGGETIMSENNKHIGFWARTPLPQIAPKDEGIQAFILHKLPHKVRVNNYKGLGGK